MHRAALHCSESAILTLHMAIITEKTCIAMLNVSNKDVAIVRDLGFEAHNIDAVLLAHLARLTLPA